ncbi:MAG: tetratricopeptide repeat protein [Deltaproteobacteria bacterium]|nr:tetratricopeptide repeat protein [Deltaproteobacteria bacterium]
MTFLSRLFSKTADDYLARGDRLLEAEHFFEARSAYEDGLQRHLGGKPAGADDAVALAFGAKIAQANRSLAEMNIGEAEYALGRGAHAKAAEHLELAITLTSDAALREKAEILLAICLENINDTNGLAPSAGSCRSCSAAAPEERPVVASAEPDLSPLDYYDLLIRQLPGEMYDRYAGLGERFACMYLAASRDEHEEALDLLDEWYDGSSSDIYFYEKGMILHRLGNTREAEDRLREAMAENAANPLPHLGLALLLIDGERLDEAADHLDTMIADGILPGHALMLRGDICQVKGDPDGAISRYGDLLTTPFARQAAENLHGVLTQSGRMQEAAAVYKRYLGGCRH